MSSSYDFEVRVATDQIKNKNYLEVPNSIIISNPPKSNPEYIFSWAQYQYYPLRIYNVQSNAPLSDSSVVFQVDIHFKDESDVESFAILNSTSVPGQKGIYWLRAFRPHKLGIFKLVITPQSEKLIVPPISYTIFAINDGDTIIDKSTMKESENVEERDELEDIISDNGKFDENNDENDQNSSRKRQKTSLDDTEIIPLYTNESITSLKFPNLNDLKVNDRLNRSNESKVIKGPDITITLPPLLLLALQDDNFHLKIIQMKFNQEYKNKKINVELISNNDKNPCVNEIITFIHDNFIIKKEYNDIIKLFYQLFEFLLPNYLLYNYEKQIISYYIDHIRNNNLLYGDYFNGIYLLRLIIYIVISFDKNKMNNINDNNIISKVSKANISSLKEVINIFINQLNEYAHLLF